MFLLKGDPGSGKSVALRRLSINLSKEKSIIPIYVNLKFWKGGWEKEKWSPQEKRERIRQFVFESLERELEGDTKIQLFLREKLPEEMTKGRCYFLVDSFDEMPCLLGKGNQEVIISDISKSLHSFMTLYGQGGVVASREYHSPSNEIGADIVLWIQDFDEARIRKMIFKYLPSAGKTVWQELKKSEDMLFLCRNPFYLTMLINYMMESFCVIPQKQVDLFRGFITHNIQQLFNSQELNKDYLFKKATELALFLEEIGEYECLVTSLPGSISEWKNVLSVLEKTRICRFGGNNNNTITFTHRRFQEFFIVLDMNSSPSKYEDVIYNSIIRYTDMRDASVLYCEVADRNIAENIATYCWKVIQENFSLSKNEWNKEVLINTLFFMADAFRRRRIIIKSFSREFEMKIIQWFDESNDYGIQLGLVNCMVLFRQNNLRNYILKVFEKGNSWLDSAVMNNCRIIRKIDSETENAFYNYLHKMPFITFFQRFQSLHVALSISTAFRNVYRRHTVLLLKYIIEVLLLMLIIIMGTTKQLMSYYGVMIVNFHFPHITDRFWIALRDWLDWHGYYFKFAIFRMFIDWYDAIYYFLCLPLLVCIFIDVSRHLRKTILRYSSFENIDFTLLLLSAIINGLFLVDVLKEKVEVLSWDTISCFFISLLIMISISLYDTFKGWKYLRAINEQHIWSIIYYLSLSILYVFSFRYGYTYSSYFEKVRIVILVLCFGPGIINYSFLSILYLRSAIKDRNTLSRWNEMLSIDSTIAIDRADVYTLLVKELNTKRGRIRFTELLVEKKVKLKGVWPKEFFDINLNEMVMHNIALVEWRDKPVGKRL